eukprot:3024482-Amphidinium_carterae.2
MSVATVGGRDGGFYGALWFAELPFIERMVVCALPLELFCPFKNLERVPFEVTQCAFSSFVVFCCASVALENHSFNARAKCGQRN